MEIVKQFKYEREKILIHKKHHNAMILFKGRKRYTNYPLDEEIRKELIEDLKNDDFSNYSIKIK